MHKPTYTTQRSSKTLAITVVVALAIIPFVASASWWNPVSWFGGWFGIFDKYEVEEVISTTTPDGVAVEEGGFFSKGGSFFSRAKPKSSPIGSSTEVSPSVNPSPTPPPTSGGSTPPPPAKNPTPQPQPSSGILKPTAVQTGVVSFSGNVTLARRTTGTATSSNTMYIGFPSTTTKVTIKQTAVSGITFKTDLCKSSRCIQKNVISVSDKVAEGTYPVSVTVTSGTSTAIGKFSIIVLPAEALEIQMTMSGPITVKKNVNGSVSGSNTLTVQLLRGTPQKLEITHSEFPDGITGKEILGTCTPPCKLNNSIKVTNEAESGRHPLVLRATAGGISKSVSYDVNVGYASGFGMHFDGEKRTYTQNQNPTALITMDYPFDLILDGGTPETATLTYSPTTGSTSVQFSRTSCLLPCMGLNARIQMLPGMKVTTHTVKLIATVEREEDDGRGGTKIVKYTETRSIPVKIVPLALPF